MSIVNKTQLTYLGIVVLILVIILSSIYVADIDRLQGYKKARVSQLRDLLEFYISTDEEYLKDESVFFRLAREAGVLREHPLTIDKLKECYNLQKIRTVEFPVIIENNNVGSEIKFSAYIDGRIDVQE